MDRSIPFVAHRMGMPAFPAHLVEAAGDMGDHVTGFAVIGWLTRCPMERWGEEWPERGTMQVRFRRGLHVGDPLTIHLCDLGDDLRIEVAAPNGELVASGSAALPASPRRFEPATSPAFTGPLLPYADDLVGRTLDVLETDFVAARDLAFVHHLEPDDPWRVLRIAHPAHVVSVANLLVKQSVAFTTGTWTHAGSSTANLRPIADGAALRCSGSIPRVIRTPEHDFAVAEIVVEADGVASMLVEHTLLCERR